MNIRYHLQKILVTTEMITLAMTWYVDDSGSVRNTGAAEITDTCLYVVSTTGNTRSQQVQSLIDRLNGARDIQCIKKSLLHYLNLLKDLKRDITYINIIFCGQYNAPYCINHFVDKLMLMMKLLL